MARFLAFKKLLLLLVVQILFSVLNLSAVADPGILKKTYCLEYVESAEVEIDGTASEDVWKGPSRESGFSFPWNQAPAPATIFQGFYTSEYVYFYFKVSDPDLVIFPGLAEHAVAEGDRVELFFSAGLDMKKYFCLEIDPSGRVLDYQASFYRKFDNNWDLEGLRAAGRVTREGYAVEVAVPTGWFRETGISSMEQNSSIIAGIYRGEFSHESAGVISQKWISWINPEIESPDFHIPSSLGLFILGSGTNPDCKGPFRER